MIKLRPSCFLLCLLCFSCVHTQCVSPETLCNPRCSWLTRAPQFLDEEQNQLIQKSNTYPENEETSSQICSCTQNLHKRKIISIAGYDEQIYLIIEDIQLIHTTNEIPVIFYLYQNRKLLYLGCLNTSLEVLEMVLRRYNHYFCINDDNIQRLSKANCGWCLNDFIYVPSLTERLISKDLAAQHEDILNENLYHDLTHNNLFLSESNTDMNQYETAFGSLEDDIRKNKFYQSFPYNEDNSQGYINVLQGKTGNVILDCGENPNLGANFNYIKSTTNNNNRYNSFKTVCIPTICNDLSTVKQASTKPLQSWPSYYSLSKPVNYIAPPPQMCNFYEPSSDFYKSDEKINPWLDYDSNAELVDINTNSNLNSVNIQSSLYTTNKQNLNRNYVIDSNNIPNANLWSKNYEVQKPDSNTKLYYFDGATQHYTSSDISMIIPCTNEFNGKPYFDKRLSALTTNVNSYNAYPRLHTDQLFANANNINNNQDDITLPCNLSTAGPQFNPSPCKININNPVLTQKEPLNSQFNNYWPNYYLNFKPNNYKGLNSNLELNTKTSYVRKLENPGFELFPANDDQIGHNEMCQTNPDSNNDNKCSTKQGLILDSKPVISQNYEYTKPCDWYNRYLNQNPASLLPCNSNNLKDSFPKNTEIKCYKFGSPRQSYTIDNLQLNFNDITSTLKTVPYKENNPKYLETRNDQSYPNKNECYSFPSQSFNGPAISIAPITSPSNYNKLFSSDGTQYRSNFPERSVEIQKQKYPTRYEYVPKVHQNDYESAKNQAFKFPNNVPQTNLNIPVSDLRSQDIPIEFNFDQNEFAPNESETYYKPYAPLPSIKQLITPQPTVNNKLYPKSFNYYYKPATVFTIPESNNDDDDDNQANLIPNSLTEFNKIPKNILNYYKYPTTNQNVYRPTTTPFIETNAYDKMYKYNSNDLLQPLAQVNTNILESYCIPLNRNKLSLNGDGQTYYGPVFTSNLLNQPINNIPYKQIERKMSDSFEPQKFAAGNKYLEGLQILPNNFNSNFGNYPSIRKSCPINPNDFDMKSTFDVPIGTNIQNPATRAQLSPTQFESEVPLITQSTTQDSKPYSNNADIQMLHDNKNYYNPYNLRIPTNIFKADSQTKIPTLDYTSQNLLSSSYRQKANVEPVASNTAQRVKSCALPFANILPTSFTQFDDTNPLQSPSHMSYSPERSNGIYYKSNNGIPLTSPGQYYSSRSAKTPQNKEYKNFVVPSENTNSLNGRVFKIPSTIPSFNVKPCSDIDIPLARPQYFKPSYYPENSKTVSTASVTLPPQNNKISDPKIVNQFDQLIQPARQGLPTTVGLTVADITPLNFNNFWSRPNKVESLQAQASARNYVPYNLQGLSYVQNYNSTDMPYSPDLVKDDYVPPWRKSDQFGYSQPSEQLSNDFSQISIDSPKDNYVQIEESYTPYNGVRSQINAQDTLPRLKFNHTPWTGTPVEINDDVAENTVTPLDIPLNLPSPSPNYNIVYNTEPYIKYSQTMTRKPYVDSNLKTLSNPSFMPHARHLMQPFSPELTVNTATPKDSEVTIPSPFSYSFQTPYLPNQNFDYNFDTNRSFNPAPKTILNSPYRVSNLNTLPNPYTSQAQTSTDVSDLIPSLAVPEYSFQNPSYFPQKQPCKKSEYYPNDFTYLLSGIKPFVSPITSNYPLDTLEISPQLQSRPYFFDLSKSYPTFANPNSYKPKSPIICSYFTLDKKPLGVTPESSPSVNLLDNVQINRKSDWSIAEPYSFQHGPRNQKNKMAPIVPCTNSPYFVEPNSNLSPNYFNVRPYEFTRPYTTDSKKLLDVNVQPLTDKQELSESYFSPGLPILNMVKPELLTMNKPYSNLVCPSLEQQPITTFLDLTKTNTSPRLTSFGLITSKSPSTKLPRPNSCFIPNQPCSLQRPPPTHSADFVQPYSTPGLLTCSLKPEPLILPYSALPTLRNPPAITPQLQPCSDVDKSYTCPDIPSLDPVILKSFAVWPCETLDKSIPSYVDKQSNEDFSNSFSPLPRANTEISVPLWPNKPCSLLEPSSQPWTVSKDLTKPYYYPKIYSPNTGKLESFVADATTTDPKGISQPTPPSNTYSIYFPRLLKPINAKPSVASIPKLYSFSIPKYAQPSKGFTGSANSPEIDRPNAVYLETTSTNTPNPFHVKDPYTNFQDLVTTPAISSHITFTPKTPPAPKVLSYILSPQSTSYLDLAKSPSRLDNFNPLQYESTTTRPYTASYSPKYSSNVPPKAISCFSEPYIPPRLTSLNLVKPDPTVPIFTYSPSYTPLDSAEKTQSSSYFPVQLNPSARFMSSNIVEPEPMPKVLDNPKTPAILTPQIQISNYNGDLPKSASYPQFTNLIRNAELPVVKPCTSNRPQKPYIKPGTGIPDFAKVCTPPELSYQNAITPQLPTSVWPYHQPTNLVEEITSSLATQTYPKALSTIPNFIYPKTTFSPYVFNYNKYNAYQNPIKISVPNENTCNKANLWYGINMPFNPNTKPFDQLSIDPVKSFSYKPPSSDNNKYQQYIMPTFGSNYIYPRIRGHTDAIKNLKLCAQQTKLVDNPNSQELTGPFLLESGISPETSNSVSTLKDSKYTFNIPKYNPKVSQFEYGQTSTPNYVPKYEYSQKVDIPPPKYIDWQSLSKPNEPFRIPYSLTDDVNVCPQQIICFNNDNEIQPSTGTHISSQPDSIYRPMNLQQHPRYGLHAPRSEWVTITSNSGISTTSSSIVQSPASPVNTPISSEEIPNYTLNVDQTPYKEQNYPGTCYTNTLSNNSYEQNHPEVASIKINEVFTPKLGTLSQNEIPQNLPYTLPEFLYKPPLKASPQQYLFTCMSQASVKTPFKETSETVQSLPCSGLLSYNYPTSASKLDPILGQPQNAHYRSSYPNYYANKYTWPRLNYYNPYNIPSNLDANINNPVITCNKPQMTTESRVLKMMYPTVDSNLNPVQKSGFSPTYFTSNGLPKTAHNANKRPCATRYPTQASYSTVNEAAGLNPSSCSILSSPIPKFTADLEYSYIASPLTVMSQSLAPTFNMETQTYPMSYKAQTSPLTISHPFTTVPTYNYESDNKFQSYNPDYHSKYTPEVSNVYPNYMNQYIPVTDINISPINDVNVEKLAITNLLKCNINRINNNNQIAELLKDKTVNINAGNVCLVKYPPNCCKHTLIPTNNPKIYMKAWRSKIKVIKAKVVLDESEYDVTNFMPIVKEPDKFDFEAVQNVVKDIVTQSYGEPIVLRGLYKIYNPYAVVCNIDDVKLNSSGKNVLWPTLDESSI